MASQISAPDGSTVQYPDGNDDATITSVMQREFGGPSAAPRQAAPTAPPARPAGPRGLLENISGAMANFNRGTGVLDEMSAALSPDVLVALGRTVVAPQHSKGVLGDAYRKSLADVRGIEDNFAAARPFIASQAKGTGMAATMLVPGGPAGQIANASRLGNMGRGAVMAGAQAAAYAAADRGTAQERLQAAGDAARNPVVLGLGAAGGALLPATSRLRSKPSVSENAPSPQRVLKDAGVSLTPGQQLGGLAKSVEDLGQRAPLVGPAIRGARQRGVESLARAQANRALEPIGEGVPRAVKTGNDSVAYVADRLGKEYDEAAAAVQQVGHDAELKAARAALESAADELPTDVRHQFNTILKNRLDSLFPDGAVITGSQLRKIQSDIGNIASKRSMSDDMGQQDLGHLLEGVSDSLKEALGRYSPDAGARIAKANEGWSNYVRLRNAASRNIANGIPSVSQLGTAVRMADRSVGKGNVAKGKAVMQDLASAAAQVMPDAFGNPGTADAIGLGGLLTGLATAPAQAVPVAGALGVAATPYLLMGRKVVERIPASASQRQLEAAAKELAELAKRDPAVAALQAQVAARLGRAGGMLATPQAAARN